VAEPCLLGLFDPRVREIAPASREGWERLRPTLTKMEHAVYLALCALLKWTGDDSATGGEIAEWAGLSVLSVRPRLTGLHAKGYVERTAAPRTSRVPAECPAHAYRALVPASAIREGRK
jgi:hypothetical protein